MSQISSDPEIVISDFSEYLINQVSLKEIIINDLKTKTNPQYATKEVIEFYQGALIELKKVQRTFELRKLGEAIN